MQSDALPEVLSFENIDVASPEAMSGDLHLVNQGIFYLSFEKFNPLKFVMQVNMGVIGMWWMYRDKKRREAAMGPWREGHSNRPLDEIAAENEHSWAVAPDEMKQVKKGLMGVQIKREKGKTLVFRLDKAQWKSLQEFASRQGWPVKN